MLGDWLDKTKHVNATAKFLVFVPTFDYLLTISFKHTTQHSLILSDDSDEAAQDRKIKKANIRNKQYCIR